MEVIVTNFKTEKEKNEHYQNKLTELTEQKKLGLLAQDELDQLHEELIVETFGKKPRKKEK